MKGDQSDPATALGATSPEEFGLGGQQGPGRAKLWLTPKVDIFPGNSE